MRFRFPLRTSHQVRGVALIIVLAFVVLLSGLVLAFFSRALSERQVSNSSAGQTRIELFAEGATATIIGDLKQEIADGSTTLNPIPAPANGSSVIYRPRAPVSGAPGTASPAVVGWTMTTNTATTNKLETDGLNNVVKISKSGVSFYPGSVPNTSGTSYPGTNYDNNGKNAPNRAAASSTADPALNGRYVSLARWNKPLLMQAKSLTDNTPVAPNGTGISSFPPKGPDWILVARNGLNPGNTGVVSALPANFGSNGVNDSSPSNGNFVTGRYAYTIYNEGGLLDANVAGYPTAAKTGNTLGSSPYSFTDQTLYKDALCYADLTQLQSFAGAQCFTEQAQVDQLVGWRNTVSAQATGTLGTYMFPNGSNTATDFFGWATQNKGRFISVADTAPLTTTNSPGNSDHLFTSRQQLIQFIMSGMNAGGTATTAQQSALQNLGTFSRTLNQPSLWPDPSRPKVKLKPSTADSNGNYVADPNFPGGNSAYSSDGSLSDIYNPVFRNIRVATSFIRNDGSTAVIGEPLVKKRFALSRLAWITYEGPSASAADEGSLLPIRIMVRRDAIQVGEHHACQKESAPPFPRQAHRQHRGLLRVDRRALGLARTTSARTQKSAFSRWRAAPHAGSDLCRGDLFRAQNRLSVERAQCDWPLC